MRSKEQTNNPRDKNKHNVFRESIRKLRYEIESSGKIFSSLPVPKRTRKDNFNTSIILQLKLK